MPNIVTVARLLMIGVFGWLFLVDMLPAAMGVYLLAFFSDVLDGYLARKYNLITNIGKILDPLADKLMLISVLMCFYGAGWISIAVPLAVSIIATVMILGSILVLLKKHVVVYADMVGKLVTGLFGVSIVLVFISEIFDISPMTDFGVKMLNITTVISAFAIVHYAFIFGKAKSE